MTTHVTMLSMVLFMGCATTPKSSAPVATSSSWTSSISEVNGHRLAIHLEPGASSRGLAELASSAVLEVSRRIAPSGEGSVLAAVNKEAGKGPVKVPEDVRVLVRRALAFGRLTEGAVDVTDAPLRALWAVGSGAGPVAIVNARERVDQGAVSIDEFEGTLAIGRSEVTLDLDALGRAYALAVAAQRLETAGAARYRLEYEGLIMLGSPEDKYWKIQLPNGPGEPPRAHRAVRLQRGAVSVLGAPDGKSIPIPGVIDPRSGSPPRTVAYALVASVDPVQSAALVRALVILGRTEGLALIASLESVEALVIDTAGYVHASEGLRQHVLRVPIDGGAP